MEKEEPVINRLIIIGNGFDLAHGFKSSYADFIKHYLMNVLNTFYKTNHFNDLLLEIRLVDDRESLSQEIVTAENAIEKFDNLRDLSRIFSVTFHSLILQNSYKKLKKYNWVDLETDYFESLNIHLKQMGQSGVVKVNAEFEFIKVKFLDYLHVIHKNCAPISSEAIHGYFTENINANEIISLKERTNVRPSRILFLNFNYTNILYNYSGRVGQHFDTTSIGIHGDLNDYFGNPIFGFGDEHDKQYLEFENNPNYKDLVKHIKSFEYSQNENYYNLIRFIESCDYQVHIYGHSCGLSDRTLLKQIFEHSHCISIKVFYHKKSMTQNDFSDKAFEIARHFSNKVDFRKKLVPFSLSKPMPQINSTPK